MLKLQGQNCGCLTRYEKSRLKQTQLRGSRFLAKSSKCLATLIFSHIFWNCSHNPKISQFTPRKSELLLFHFPLANQFNANEWKKKVWEIYAWKSHQACTMVCIACSIRISHIYHLARRCDFNNLIQNMKWHQVEWRIRSHEADSNETIAQPWCDTATKCVVESESSYKLCDCRGLALKSHNTANMCVHHKTICEVLSFRLFVRCAQNFARTQNRKTS